MENSVSLDDIAIGILTWRTPDTLSNTLKSYHDFGLLNVVGEALLFVNEVHPNDLKIAQSFNLTTIQNEENIGIGRAVTQLVESTSKPFFMFLENDWELIEPLATLVQRLETGLQLISSGEAVVVRYRHRKR